MKFNNEDQIGYIYIIKTSSGLYKLGKTINIDQRHKTFRSIDPFAKRIIVALVEDYHTVERELIKKFKHKRRHARELFSFSRDDLLEIEQHLEYRKTLDRRFEK